MLTRSLRNSLSSCFVNGWVPLATLHWPSFMREIRTGGSWRILQSRFPLMRAVRERISVAGYDRVGPVFFKVRRGYRTTPPLLKPNS